MDDLSKLINVDELNNHYQNGGNGTTTTPKDNELLTKESTQKKASVNNLNIKTAQIATNSKLPAASQYGDDFYNNPEFQDRNGAMMQ